MVSRRFSPLYPLKQQPWHLILCLSAAAIYIAAFLTLIGSVGPAVGALAIVPVAAVGWYFGMPAALAAALLCIPLNTILLNLGGYPGWLTLFRHGGGPGIAALIVVGFVIGKISDLIGQLKAQIRIRQRAEKRAHALAGAGRRLSGAGTPEEVGHIILSVADELVQWDAGSFDLYRPEDNTIQPVVSIDIVDGKRVDVPPAYNGSPSPVVRQVIEHGSQLILRDPTQADTSGLVPFGDTTRRSESLLFVPLRHGPQVLGVLSIQSYTMQAYDQDDLEAVQALADHCGSALNRIQAERKLRDEQARYRLLFEQSLVPTYIYDLATRQVLEANPAFLKVLGYTQSEALRLHLDEVVLLDKAGLDQALEQLRQRGQIVYGERQWRRKDGGLVDVLVSAARIHSVERDIAFVMAQDITALKSAERGLRHAEHRYRTLFEGAPIMYVVTRAAPTGPVISDCNGMFLSELGYARDEVMGRPLTDFYDAPSRDALVQGGYDRALAGNFIAEERRLVTRSGQVRDVLLQALPEADESGNLVGTRAMFLDITERKQAEAALQRQLQQMTALRAVDTAITASLDLRLTLNILLDQIMTQLLVDAANILLLNAGSQQFEYAASRGFRTPALQFTRLALGEGYAGQAALRREVLSVPDLRRRTTDFLRSPHFAQEGFIAYHAVPLIAKGKVTGVLEIFHRRSISPDQDWLNFLETLAVQAAIAVDNAALFDQLQRANVELMLAYDATIEGWSRALDLRDRETEGHTQRVTEIALELARAMNFSEKELVALRRGGLLHDIGKLGVPDNILHKPGPLTEAEWNIMRQHPEYAYQMLWPIEYLRPALDIPYCHHERWDGTGYPRGLQGEQIPLAARIFAVVDVWDALMSDRPYRPAWPKEKVLDYLWEQAGKHFDPQVVEAFLNLPYRQGSTRTDPGGPAPGP